MHQLLLTPIYLNHRIKQCEHKFTRIEDLAPTNVATPVLPLYTSLQQKSLPKDLIANITLTD